MRKLLFYIFFILLILLMTGCDERETQSYSIVSMSVSPSHLFADSVSTTYSDVEVYVANDRDDPGVGLTVYFETDIGYIWEKETTDDAGYIHTRFYDQGETGVAHIYAYLKSDSGNGLHKTIDIYPYPSYLISRLKATPCEIYADNGETQSEIEILLRDQDGVYASGQEVYLNCSMGSITPSVVTDSLGSATAYFSDNGETGTASLTASAGISDSTVYITILPVNPVYDLFMEISNDKPSVDEVVEIIVNVIEISGYEVEDQDVAISTNLGYFQPSIDNFEDLGQNVTAEVTDGIAHFWLNTGTESGENPITAEFEDVHLTNSIMIFSGAPTELAVSITDENGLEQNTIPAGSEDYLYINATVHDTYGNPSDLVVSFRSSLGMISSTVLPDENGVAVSQFTSCEVAGTSEITITTGDLEQTEQIYITSTGIAQICFAEDPYPLPAGWEDPGYLSAHICDEFGNYADDPVEVWFMFLNRPEGNDEEGSNLAQTVFNLEDSLSVISENGQAVIPVYSGTETGDLLIRVWCRPQPDLLVSNVYDNMSVVSGEPASIEISSGGIDSAEEFEGGLWEIPVSALMHDNWGNPVSDGTAVYFQMTGDFEFAAFSTEYTYVGNENMQGETIPGMANVTLIYDGGFSNESVTVSVETTYLTETADIDLPLQYGEISMICVPSHVDWTEDNVNEEILYTQCRINIRDGVNNPVNKQRVMFNTTLGFPTDAGEHLIHPVYEDIENDENYAYLLEICDYTGINAEDPQDDNDGYTGPYDGDLGRLYKDVGYHVYECPAPIPAPPGMTTGCITATIFGTDISTSQTVTLLRYVN